MSAAPAGLQSGPDPADGMGVKALPPRSFLFAALAVVAACATQNQVADLAENSVLYADVPFRTKAPGDRTVFVAPMADARSTAALPTHERGFPIAYAADDFWERPVAAMVGDIVVRQLTDSLLFPALEPAASPQGLVVVPSLVQFFGGTQTAISGSRSFAEVAVRLQVFGPIGADGERPSLHDQVYRSRQASEQELNPVSPYRLFGRALQLTMNKALQGLDGSNVARSTVPTAVVPGLPAEASAPGR